MSGVQQAVFQNQRSFLTPPGQDAYTSPGTYSWVAPSGVTSVSVVVVGNARFYKGGALAYKNNIAVTPASSYTVVVAAQNANSLNYFSSTATVSAKFDAKTGDGGGFSGTSSAGGSGAGGYSGNGGDGGSTGGSSGTSGAGGGGGGGGGGLYVAGDVYSGGGGGGVGLLGEGSSGAGGTWDGTNIATGGGGGSGGTSGGTDTGSGSIVNGGLYGGGGGAGGGGYAGLGAVRIIWPGADRSFPSTDTGDV